MFGRPPMKVLGGILAILFIAIILFIFTFNDWILKHDTPKFLRTIVYLCNPPSDLRRHIVLVQIKDGLGKISYYNEYYGKYAIYMSGDKAGKEYVKLPKEIEYRISCNGSTTIQESGRAAYLPKVVYWYSVPDSLPIEGRIACELIVQQSEGNNELFLYASKLSDI